MPTAKDETRAARHRGERAGADADAHAPRGIFQDDKPGGWRDTGDAAPTGAHPSDEDDVSPPDEDRTIDARVANAVGDVTHRPVPLAAIPARWGDAVDPVRRGANAPAMREGDAPPTLCIATHPRLILPTRRRA